MANITFIESSGVNDSIFGKSQAPIRMFLEKSGEAFEQQSVIKEIFGMDKSDSWAEKYTTLTAIDDFEPVGENGSYPVSGMREGYNKVIEHVTWKNKFSLSREMVDDAKITDLKKQPSKFITSYYRTREKFGAGLLGNAVMGSTFRIGGHTFSTKTADNKNLFATDHPSIVGKSNQSNKFTDGFSADNLAKLECAMQNFRGDNGEVLDVVPDTIIIPNEYTLKKAVFEAVGADKDPNTANNGFNYQFGRWNIIVWPYLNEFMDLSAYSPWILCDSKYAKENGGAMWYDRVPLEVKSTIAENDANEWKGYSRFSAGFGDWRAFALSIATN